MNDINPFDICSGKLVKTIAGTFYFKEAGINLDAYGWPKLENLHRTNGPAIIWNEGFSPYGYSDKKPQKNLSIFKENEQYYIDGKFISKNTFDEMQNRNSKKSLQE